LWSAHDTDPLAWPDRRSTLRSPRHYRGAALLAKSGSERVLSSTGPAPHIPPPLACLGLGNPSEKASGRKQGDPDAPGACSINRRGQPRLAATTIRQSRKPLRARASLLL